MHLNIAAQLSTFLQIFRSISAQLKSFFFRWGTISALAADEHFRTAEEALPPPGW
jgi:hypothetical protein